MDEDIEKIDKCSTCQHKGTNNPSVYDCLTCNRGTNWYPIETVREPIKNNNHSYADCEVIFNGTKLVGIISINFKTVGRDRFAVNHDKYVTKCCGTCFNEDNEKSLLICSECVVFKNWKRK